ncbi:MAG: prepilin-type N-terminal cleavage/methylation domain-containing protein [Rickettsiales bacterium]|nr:prepilin-type N-terminal cleavage/methylation domain-containing protein [Rickettsiales bacterium]
MRNNNNQHGFTTVELLLAMVVGSVVLAAAYSSYTIISNQHSRLSSISEVQSSGLPTLRLLARDLRMAGNQAIDPTTLDAVFGSSIANPITVLDNGVAGCCDEFTVEYDRSDTERLQIRYYTAAQVNPNRTALYVDILEWNTVTSDFEDRGESGVLVTDYVVDFQVERSNPVSTGGEELLVDLYLALRGKNRLTRELTYTKPIYSAGNSNINITDRFHVDEFNATIYLRNLRD